MRRRLIRQGRSTLTVSLPKKWAHDNRLRPGDELEVLPAGAELRLLRPVAVRAKSKQVDVSGMTGALVRATLNALYIIGEDELHIACRKEQHRLIQDAVDRLIGMAVVEQRPALFVVRDVTAPGDVEFDTLLRRIYRMVLDLADECLADFELKAEDRHPQTTPEQAAERDFGINRFVNFSLRQLSRQGHLDARKTAAYFHLLLLLELVADEYTNLWKALVQPETEAGKYALALYKQALSTTRTCYGLLYKYDHAEASHVTRTRDIIRSQLSEGKSPEVQLFLAFHLRKIAEFSVNLLQAQLLLTA